jgi:hypothetical protein
MKIYLVRRGWESQDCTSKNMAVFDSLEKARAAVLGDLAGDEAMHKERFPKGAWSYEEQVENDVLSWTIYNSFDEADPIMAEETWIIESWVVQ